LTSRVPAFKVIGTDTDLSTTYDFLLTFHSNQWPISYRFRDKRRFQSKIAKFTPVYFPPMLKGFCLELDTGSGGQNTRMMVLHGWERNLTISSAVGIQYTNVTDGRTPDDSKDCTYA